MGDAAQFGFTLDVDVVAHELDEGNLGCKRLAATLEAGAHEGCVPPAAAAAAPPRYACGGRAVPPASASHLNSAVYMTYELTMLDVPSRYLFAFKRNITFRIST